MGNHLSGIAPSQIFPVEYYMSELGDLQFESSLGSTRFLKVARARHKTAASDASHSSQLVVVKVFTAQDLGLNLRTYRDHLLDVKRGLEGCLNCLPFQRVFVTDRAGFLVRQYIKDSLYDRMSTRPFLTQTEKKWIAFQLLLAIQQAHKHGVCHGDIKVENVMVTSWNWVFLTDFASFKPTFLPEDNPADFSYFFDTSRRRTCYIAPERVKTRHVAESTATSAALISTMEGSGSQSESETHAHNLPDYEAEDIESGELAPSMDIFSAGCVLVELFTDAPPFTFSNLLAYRAGEFSPEKILDKIDDVNIRAMLSHMISKEPGLRHTANEYLAEQKGKVFPEYFYSFLQSYMQIFSTDSTMVPDQKIMRISENINGILDMMITEPDFDSHGLGLLVTLVTANIRSLRFCDPKMAALDVLARMAPHVTNETVLDRILPFVILMVKDPFPSVRIRAIKTLMACLAAVNVVPLSDANIFPEYILPNVLPLCHDKNELVRAAMAKFLAELAQQSVRYLDLALQSLGSRADGPMLAYEAELAVLHESVGHAVSILMADNDNMVKQSLMEESVTRLAVFFGKQKANDVLLSHMITFLNDKEDPQLRASFYENLVGVATFIGWQSSQIISPLLQQGLSDPEEFVTASCIAAMSALTELDLLQKASLLQLLRESAPFLLHPNLWVRQAAAGFLAAAAARLEPVDVLVKLGAIAAPYLQRQVIQLHDAALILANVESHIPRVLFEAVLRSPDPTAFFSVLEERQTRRTVSSSTAKAGQLVHAEMSQSMQHLFRRLVSDGMTPSVEDKFLHLKDSLIKTARNQQQHVADVKMLEGVFELADLADSRHLEVKVETLHASESKQRLAPIQEHQALPSVNEEWQHMFGPAEASSASSSSSSPALSARAAQRQRKMLLEPRASVAVEATSLNSGAVDNLPAGYTYAPCKTTLDGLLTRKHEEFSLRVRKKHQMSHGAIEKNYPPPGWRPRGVLVAHLHEHQGGITKLVRLPERPILASAASDGFVRLWDLCRLEGSSTVFRSHCHLNSHDKSPLTTLAACASRDLLASASEAGGIAINSVETSSALHRRRLSLDEDGPAVELCFQETGSSPILVYATAFGAIVGWDLRQPGHAFKLQNELRNGLQTAFAISPEQSWAVSGTSSGHLSCWDLRFQLPVVACSHPAEARIRQLVVQPGAPSTVMAAVHGNNEVGFWNMESQFRQLVLWASPAPLLSNTAPSSQSVTAMQYLPASGGIGSALLTAGTDMRLRLWNLSNPQESTIVVGAGNESLSQVSYRSKLVDGVEVVHEVHAKPKASAALSSSPESSSSSFSRAASASAASTSTDASIDAFVNKPGLEAPAQGHHDWISGLSVCQAVHWYIATGSRDGIIKIWL